MQSFACEPRNPRRVDRVGGHDADATQLDTFQLPEPFIPISPRPKRLGRMAMRCIRASTYPVLVALRTSTSSFVMRARAYLHHRIYMSITHQSQTVRCRGRGGGRWLRPPCTTELGEGRVYSSMDQSLISAYSLFMRIDANMAIALVCRAREQGTWARESVANPSCKMRSTTYVTHN